MVDKDFIERLNEHNEPIKIYIIDEYPLDACYSKSGYALKIAEEVNKIFNKSRHPLLRKKKERLL